MLTRPLDDPASVGRCCSVRIGCCSLAGLRRYFNGRRKGDYGGRRSAN